MSLTVVKGDLFEGDYEAIGHGVNCYGMMGAGIAKPFAEKFPGMFYTYRQLCYDRQLRPGQIHAWQENGQFGYNIASQDAPGRNAKMDYLIAGVGSALRHAEREGIRQLALPAIGCGIGGLELNNVLEALSNIVRPKVDLVVVTL